MATHTLTPLATASSPTFQGGDLNTLMASYAVTPNGDSDYGLCVKVSGDGKDITGDQDITGFPGIQFYFQDDSVIPLGATINSVKFTARIKGVGVDTNTFGANSCSALNSGGSGAAVPFVSGTLGAAYSTFESDTMLVNPVSTNPWTRAELFNDGDAGFNANGGWTILLQATAGTYSMGWDFASLVVDYTAGSDPTLSSIDVSSGEVTGGDTITITGTNFDSCDSSEIFIGGEWTPATVVSPTEMTIVTPQHYDVDMTSGTATVDLMLRCSSGVTSTLAAAFTWEPVWWDFAVPEGLDLDVEPFHFFGYGFPDLEDLDWLRKQLKFSLIDWRRLLVKYPSFRWWTPSTAPDTHGWYYSTASFGGDVYVVDSSDRPVNPRKWSQIATFATGATGMLGGSPGAACVKDNRLYYAAANYTSSTDLPPIRIAKGGSDYQLATVPKTAAGVVPYVLVSMLADNGTVYVSSLDSGTSSADWSGRVFEFDTNSGQLTALGSTFPTGHVPYALTFHNGKLWCGTHKQTAAGAGRVYWIRPGVDTDWTLDLTLSSGNVTSMLGFQGQLYIGTTDAAGSRGLVRQRTTAGVWSTVETGSGGTARDGNGYLALGEFENTLYASYWNDDSGATIISKIRKSADGSTWANSYAGASGTLRPFIGLTSDSDFLFAIGGGTARTAALVRTADGTTWTDLTGFLPDTTETFVPVFGVVVR